VEAIDQVRICVMIEDVKVAYDHYFTMYPASSEIQRKFGISEENQTVVRNKLEFLAEREQVEQLAQALLLGTCHNTEDEESFDPAAAQGVAQEEFFTLVNFLYDKLNPRQ